MKNSYKILATLGLFLGLGTPLLAQEETGGDEVKSVEIRVVEEYQAQVRSAHKISEQPSFADNTSEKLPVDVKIKPKAMALDFTPKPIPAIRLGRVKLPKLPTQSFSLGGGNYGSSLATFTLSSPRSKKNVWGVRAVHQGSLNGVNQVDYANQAQYENEVLADFQRATKHYNLKTQALIKADYISYYGANTPLAVVLDTTPGNWQQQFGISQQWLKTTNPTSKVKLAYRSGGVSYNYTNGGFNTTEHLAKTKHRFEIYGDEQDIMLDLGYQYAAVESWADTAAAAYQSFTVAPFTSGQKGILSYAFGVNFTGTQSTGLATDRFEYYVFPKINLQAELLRRVLAVYAGWDGTAHQNTLQSIMNEVPFITMNQEYRLSGTNRIYGGAQGALAGKLQYRAEVSITAMSNALVFGRDSTMFTVVEGENVAALQAMYAGNVVKSTVRGELNLPLKDFVASTFLELNAYRQNPFLAQEGQVIGGMLTYAINELSVGANFKYVAGRFNGAGYELFPLEDYMDLSARIDYEINANLSLSVRAYNLLNQRYMMWQGYGVRGTRGMFVLNYQF